ncbi:MAG: carbohydrate-binding domain-containing protein [Clostridia bacterium]|jgi:hypothetical protein|nr:carbohydrate-binding domain-containing protein [Clostridia bacterium]MCI2000163.1 carbohydrate-binding domain-containing protein [Clostridia bacterium]MCI2014672.1 carbohydrate-binding domain-containing protein [Clostridia bacterium]
MKMNFLRNIMAISALSTAVVLSGCSSSSVGIADKSKASEIELISMSDADFSSDDKYIDWKNSEYTTITAENGTFKVDGEGAEANGNTVTINHKGTFVLSGTMDDGYIIVNSSMSGKVRLVLNNFSITCSNGAPIYIKDSDVMLSLSEGTVNNVTDSADYTYKYYDETDSSPNAAIFAKDDLVINGTGTLNVTANHKNAIQSKDDLKVVEGTINITSVDDGFVGKDMAAFKDATITLKTDGDSIKSTGTDNGTGYIIIGGGTFDIDSQNDALQASNELCIEDGKFNIKTGDGDSDFSSSQGEGMGGGMPSRPDKSDFGSSDKNTSAGTSSGSNAKLSSDSTNNENTPSGMTPPDNGIAPDMPGGNAPSDMSSNKSETESMKGIKSDTTIHITGGTFNIDTEDDAVHSNSTVIIDGGKFSINTGDDAMHADNTLTVNNGGISISNCYEGLEAAKINVNGGNIDVNATDDGVNASEKKATESTENTQQQNTSNDSNTSQNNQISENTSDSKSDGSSVNSEHADRPSGNNMDSSNAVLNITGGTLNVNAYGDGLDANGSIYMSGGSVTVSGPINDGNGDLDYDSVFEITGGTLVSAGSSGMAQNPSDTSSQYSIAGILDNQQSANSVVSLTDDNGNKILSFTVPKIYSHLVFSSSKIKYGETYHILVDGNEVKSVEVSEIVSLFSEMKNGMSGGPVKGMEGRKTDNNDLHMTQPAQLKQTQQ